MTEIDRILANLPESERQQTLEMLTFQIPKTTKSRDAFWRAKIAEQNKHARNINQSNDRV